MLILFSYNSTMISGFINLLFTTTATHQKTATLADLLLCRVNGHFKLATC